MLLLLASGESLLDFPSPRHLSSSGSYILDLSGLGDPTGNNATAGFALRVTDKPLYHGKVETNKGDLPKEKKVDDHYNVPLQMSFLVTAHLTKHILILFIFFKQSIQVKASHHKI
jgi:hypothetical protein